MAEKIEAHPHQASTPNKRIDRVYRKFKNAASPSKRKVFCIGFNKTGTGSLHHFFKELGLTSSHNTSWPIYSRAHKIKKRNFRKQCYSDGEKSDFIALDSAFPNSLFILNNRNERDWLYSRLKHVLRYNESVNTSNLLSDKRFRWMERDFFFNEDLAIRKWICERRIYTMQARQYFKDRVDFIEIDVASSDQWMGALLDFFKMNSFPTGQLSADKDKTVHRHKRDSDFISDQSLLTKYKQLVDNILAEINGSQQGSQIL